MQAFVAAENIGYTIFLDEPSFGQSQDRRMMMAESVAPDR